MLKLPAALAEGNVAMEAIVESSALQDCRVEPWLQTLSPFSKKQPQV